MELLIRVHNKEEGKDVYEDAQRTKRGDIIAVCPDGWKWNNEDVRDSSWRILKVPSLTKQASTLYDRGEFEVRITKDGANPFDKSATSQKRAYKFDLDNLLLSQAAIDYLNDDSRASPTFTLQDITGMVVQKLAIADPRVISS